jgi:hypothetical protein
MLLISDKPSGEMDVPGFCNLRGEENDEMKRLLVGMLTFMATAFGQDITAAERDKAFRYLAETRKGVEDAVKGLTDAQWKYKPAPERWSVAEVVEHLAVIEDVIKTVFARYPEGPAPLVDRETPKFDAELVAKVTDRSTKFEAPPQARPAARWTPEGAVQHFLASREQTVELMRTTPGLRAHAVPHPVFGPLDGYQWILAVAAHTARHTQQILEVKADAGFPPAHTTAAPALH